MCGGAELFVPLGAEKLQGRQRFPAVTAAVAVLNGLFFLVEAWISVTGGTEALQHFIATVGLGPLPWQTGQDSLLPFYVTLFTSMFVHAGVLHVGANLLYLLTFGRVVEERLGHWRFLVLFLLSGAVAALVQGAVAPVSPVPPIGSSGAIAGVLGAYLLLSPFGLIRVYLIAGPLTRVGRAPTLVFAAIWFLLQFFSGIGALSAAAADSATSVYWAHLGGFAAGLALGWLFRRITKRREGMSQQ